MIFDDCSLSDRRGQVPNRGTGNIIYTSRSTDLTRDLPPECVYEVTPFGEADAIDLLLRASGSSAAPDNSQDRVSAEAIVRELGYLPLAIDKAAAIIRDENQALHDYLRDLRDQKVRTLSEHRLRGQDVENPTVYAALELSYEALMARRRREGRSDRGLGAIAALKVLNLLCFYHHNEIKVAVVARAAKEQRACGADALFPLSRLVSPHDSYLDWMLQTNGDGTWNCFWFALGLNILRSLSLVKISPDKRTISMHVLVHGWARQRLEKDPAMFRQWALVAAVILVESLHPSRSLADKIFARQLHPHAQVCLPYDLDRFDFGFAQYEAHLLEKLAFYRKTEQRFQEAKRCMERAVYLWRKEGGTESYRALDCQAGLARVNREMGCLAEAELLYLEIIERLGEKHKQSTTPQELGPESHVSRASTKRVPWSLTETLSKHAADAVFRAISTDHARSILKGKEVAPSETFPPVSEAEDIDMYINAAHAELGKVYMEQGRYGMGKRMLIQAVGYLKGQTDEYDPDLLRLRIDAAMETDHKNPEFWHKLHDDLLAAGEAAQDFFQSEAHCTMLIATAASYIRSDSKNWKQSAVFLLDLYPHLVKFYGHYAKSMLMWLRCLVECYILGEKYDWAVDNARKCLERAKQGYGECHRETILAYDILSMALLSQKREVVEEDYRILEEGFQRSSAGLGRTHPTTERIWRRLEWYREELQEKQKAEEESRLRREEGLKICRDEAEDLKTMLKRSQASIDADWQSSKEELERLTAEHGPEHIVVKLFATFVGDRPPRSLEELVERARAAFGPHNSSTKQLEKDLERDRAKLARQLRGRELPEIEIPDDATSADVTLLRAGRIRIVRDRATVRPSTTKRKTARSGTAGSKAANCLGITATVLEPVSETIEDEADNSGQVTT